MLVLCYGIPKSGSTLAFELVKGMLQSAGFEQETLVNDRLDPERLKRATTSQRNYVSSLTKQKIKRLMTQIGPDRKIAVKTHARFHDGLFSWIERLQADGELQVIASYRDPREICLSLMDAGAAARSRGVKTFSGVGDIRRARRNVQKRIEEFRKWASLPGTLRLSYNTVAFAPDDAIDRIEEALNIKCNREAAKKYAFEIASTQKNKAVKDRYRLDLTPEQNGELLDVFGEFIERACERDDQAWFSSVREEIFSRPPSEPVKRRRRRRKVAGLDRRLTSSPSPR
jgi:hypothetical protein